MIHKILRSLIATTLMVALAVIPCLLLIRGASILTYSVFHPPIFLTLQPTPTPCPFTPIEKNSNRWQPQKIEFREIHLTSSLDLAKQKKNSWDLPNSLFSFAEGTSFIASPSGVIGIFANVKMASESAKQLTTVVRRDQIHLSNESQIAIYSVLEARSAEKTDDTLLKSESDGTLVVIVFDGLITKKQFIIRAEPVGIVEKECYELSTH